jgi:hypothetical protein
MVKNVWILILLTQLVLLVPLSLSLQVVKNELQIVKGGVTSVASRYLQATSSSSSDSAIVFHVLDVEHGYFSFITNPTVGITTFDQQQVKNGQILFTHDSSSIASTYFMNVTDEVDSIGPFRAIVTMLTYQLHETTISPVSTATKTAPFILSLKNNAGYFVTWSNRATVGANIEIYANFLGTSFERIGSEFRTHSSLASTQSNCMSIQLNSTLNIFALRVNQNGAFANWINSVSAAIVGNEIAVGSGIIVNPRVASINDNFLVTWAVSPEIFGQVYASGTAVGSNFKISTTTGIQTSPDITALSTEKYVVVWVKPKIIVAQILNPSDGSIYVPEFQVTNDTAVATPCVLSIPGGRFVVSWVAGSSSTTSIRAAIYYNNGTLFRSDFLVSQVLFCSLPSVTVLSNGNIVFVWLYSSVTLKSRLFDTDGNSLSNEFVVNTISESTNQRLNPVAIHSSVGNFAVPYFKSDRINATIYSMSYVSLVTNQVLINQRYTIMTSDNIYVLGDNIHISVLELQYCHFENISGTNITTFTQEDVNNGLVVLVYDDNGRIPSFRLYAYNTLISSAIVSADIVFRPDNVCAGVKSSNSTVCSGRGNCERIDMMSDIFDAPGECHCISDWVGSTCAVPVCFGLNQTDTQVCSSNGYCSAPDTCLCNSGYTDVDCSLPICFNLNASNTMVCSTHGVCTNPDVCSCENGYNEVDCSVPICFGLNSTDHSVCASHGDCVSPNICECSSGYISENCSIPVCFEVAGNVSSTCSSHGSCIAHDVCDCINGYIGSDCHIAVCYEIPGNSTSVCSGHGTCTQYDTCVCDMDFTGSDCSIPICFGINASDTSVCSSHGLCIDENLCHCDTNWSGNNCSIPVCFGASEDKNQTVCTGHGVCIDSNVCECEDAFGGYNCQWPKCYGIVASNESCSGNGECLSFNNCSCNSNWNGFQCDIPICFGFNQSDSSVCSGHGTCDSAQQCFCDDGYVSLNCSVPLCFGLNASQSESVCNGNGMCLAPNLCDCDIGYTGLNCSIPICFNVNANESNVCSGNGLCTSPDHCTCTDGYTGTNCSILVVTQESSFPPVETSIRELSTSVEVISSSSSNSVGDSSSSSSAINSNSRVSSSNSVGDSSSSGSNSDTSFVSYSISEVPSETTTVTCFGRDLNDPMVCNGKGKCMSHNNCSCEEQYFGSQCESDTPLEVQNRQKVIRIAVGSSVGFVSFILLFCILICAVILLVFVLVRTRGGKTPLTVLPDIDLPDVVGDI